MGDQEPGISSGLCAAWLQSGSIELQEIVRQADELPLSSYFVEATEKKSSKPSDFLDLSEDRLDDLLPSFVNVAAPDCG